MYDYLWPIFSHFLNQSSIMSPWDSEIFGQQSLLFCHTHAHADHRPPTTDYRLAKFALLGSNKTLCYLVICYEVISWLRDLCPKNRILCLYTNTRSTMG
jgi:hypothetical protein